MASEAQAGIVNAEMVNKWNLASGFPYSGYLESNTNYKLYVRIGGIYNMVIGPTDLQLGDQTPPSGDVRRAAIDVQTVTEIKTGRNNSIKKLQGTAITPVLTWNTFPQGELFLAGTIKFYTWRGPRELTDTTTITFTTLYNANVIRLYYGSNKEVVKVNT